MDRVRFAAVEVVYKADVEKSYSNIVLANVLRREIFSELDRRFCTELVYGTIKTGESLDWKISKYIDRSISKIDKKVLAILRVGLYQIFFLDRIPNSAAVNESVEISKRFCGIGVSKFVNGVLRSAVRNPERSNFPNDESLESIALRSFHPLWLVKLFKREFGLKTTKELLALNNTVPPLCLRANFLKTSREALLKGLMKLGIPAIASQLVPEGIICRNVNFLDKFKFLAEGFCQIQDETSMLMARILNPSPNDFVIDCCAAPGGKATHLAELMQNRGRIIAADIYKTKLEKIKLNVQRLGIKIIETQLIDARDIGKRFSNQADKVLVDVPCSGLGVLRRKADIRWKKNLNELKELPALQTEILFSAAQTLKRNGVLLYTTCTILSSENEKVVRDFIKQNKNFEIIEMKTFLPHLINADGAFYAKLVRRQ